MQLIQPRGDQPGFNDIIEPSFLTFSAFHTCLNNGGGIVEEEFKPPMAGIYRFSFSATSAPNSETHTRIEVLKKSEITQDFEVQFWISDCSQHPGTDENTFHMAVRILNITGP